MVFTQDDARKIAKKLGAKIEQGKRRHDLAVFWYQGKRIAQFGIRRASKEVGHGHLPDELFISPHQCRDLGNCPLSREGYVAILRSKNKILDPQTP
jgi:hypothetical protein